MLGSSLQEETRTKIIGALWQYIKSNRLQESDETKYGASVVGTGQGSNNASMHASAQQNPSNLNMMTSSPNLVLGQNTSREYINANNADLLAIFGTEKIQFHQLMEKLKNHLFDVDPITIEFEIGKEAQQEGSVQSKWFQLPVECFSESQQKLVDFIAKYNYEFFDAKKEEDEKFMGVVKNQLLSDSAKGASMKKREMKANEKIQESIDKMKQHYRHKAFFEAIIPADAPGEPEHEETEGLQLKQQQTTSSKIYAPKTGSYLESYKLKQEQLKQQRQEQLQGVSASAPLKEEKNVNSILEVEKEPSQEAAE